MRVVKGETDGEILVCFAMDRESLIRQLIRSETQNNNTPILVHPFVLRQILEEPTDEEQTLASPQGQNELGSPGKDDHGTPRD